MKPDLTKLKEDLISCEDKLIRKDLAFLFLQLLGFKPFSNNNNVHIQCRNHLYKIDFWPTTCRGKVVWQEKVYNFTILSKFLGNLEKLSNVVNGIEEFVENLEG